MLSLAYYSGASVAVVVFGVMLLVHKLPSTIAVVAAADCGEIVAPNRATMSAIRVLGRNSSNPFSKPLFSIQEYKCQFDPFKGIVLFFLSFIALQFRFIYY